MCILCRKKQELLSKTGQWINKTTSPDGFIRRIEGDKSSEQFDPHDATDKRPKLERARSAAEKENLPLQRSGSALRRQYSQQEPPTTRRMSSSDDRVDMMMGPGGGVGGGGGPRRIPAQNIQYPADQSQQYSSQKYQQQQQQAYQHTPTQSQQPQHMAHIQGQQTIGSFQKMDSSIDRTKMGNYPDEDPSYYQVNNFFKKSNSYLINNI